MNQLLVSANRWQAFLAHLAASLVVLGVLVVVVVFVWFPGALINSGGWQGIKLIAGVDLVLGPLITLIVYSPQKKSLSRDMAIVLFIQVSCLLAGTYTVYKQSPALLVLSDEGLHVIKQRDLDEVDLEPLPETATFLNKPLYVLDMPDTDESRLIFKGASEVFEGKPFYFRSEFYRPYSELEQMEKSAPIKFPKKQGHGCREFPLQSDYGQTLVCVPKEAER